MIGGNWRARHARCAHWGVNFQLLLRSVCSIAYACSASEREQALAQSQPIRRAGQPDNIAAMALFLASDESEWVTGAAMLVDGGFMARAHALGSRSAADFLAPGFAGPSFQLRR